MVTGLYKCINSKRGPKSQIDRKSQRSPDRNYHFKFQFFKFETVVTQAFSLKKSLKKNQALPARAIALPLENLKPDNRNFNHSEANT